MRPFDFIILFLSFIYTLALTHLLLAASQMLRHRRRLVFSWPHALWMANALLLLVGNWLGLWDFRNLTTVTLPTIVAGFILVIGMYFVCALVTPDLDGEDGYDMRRFHSQQHRTYIAAFLALCLFGFGLNLAAGRELGVSNWTNQNVLVVGMLAMIAPPLLVERPWVQIVCPAVLLGLMLAYPVIYYPALAEAR
jgi:hypothetical protein